MHVQLEVQLSPERDRIQPPYRAVYRASYSGPKDNLVMVYLLEINPLLLIDEGGTFATIPRHGTSQGLTGHLVIVAIEVY